MVNERLWTLLIATLAFVRPTSFPSCWCWCCWSSLVCSIIPTHTHFLFHFSSYFKCHTISRTQRKRKRVSEWDIGNEHIAIEKKSGIQQQKNSKPFHSFIRFKWIAFVSFYLFYFSLYLFFYACFFVLSSCFSLWIVRRSTRCACRIQEVENVSEWNAKDFTPIILHTLSPTSGAIARRGSSHLMNDSQMCSQKNISLNNRII